MTEIKILAVKHQRRADDSTRYVIAFNSKASACCDPEDIGAILCSLVHVAAESMVDGEGRPKGDIEQIEAAIFTSFKHEMAQGIDIGEARRRGAP